MLALMQLLMCNAERGGEEKESDVLIMLTSLTVNKVDNLQLDFNTLVTNGLIVQIVEGTTQTLVEDIRVTKGQVTVISDGPANSVDSTGLWWWAVELELSVCDNRTNSASGISQDRAIQCQFQRTTGFTGDNVDGH